MQPGGRKGSRGDEEYRGRMEMEGLGCKMGCRESRQGIVSVRSRGVMGRRKGG
jgi:hypothetical protein